ncbi:MAG: hypothetical protein HKN26_10200 [Acidimicrobiales bacterium]|nr:hypothetical protein [Acidimicrobiales bacterium]
MKGKWARGIEPRNFTWIIKDRLAVCERPGGYGANHRKVRRQEEIIWIRENAFDIVFSLIQSPHNLHNYDALGVAYTHQPFNGPEDGVERLDQLYKNLRTLLDNGAKVLVHREELADHVSGMLAGYLLWAGFIETGPDVIVAIEQLVSRPLGPVGREIVSLAIRARDGAEASS